MATLHIYHATAVLSELGLAMAIGTVTRIFPQATITDWLAQETTQKRIAVEDGKIASFFYGIGCSLSNFVGKVINSKYIPILVFLFDMVVLGGIAFLPDKPFIATLLFYVSLFCLIVMTLYVYFNRETFQKTGLHPAVEPNP